MRTAAGGDLAEMNELLSALGPVWVHLNEYRITHGYLHVLLMKEGSGRPPDRIADIYLTDCLYIRSPTSGGPWKLALLEHTVDGQRRLILSDAEGVMEIAGLRCRIEDRQGRAVQSG